MVKGTIKLGKHTVGHSAWLTEHGYKVVEETGQLVIEGKEFVTELDVSSGLEALSKVVADSKLLTYKTKITFKGKDGQGTRTLYGLAACSQLGKASALVVKPVGVEKPAEKGTDFDTV